MSVGNLLYNIQPMSKEINLSTEEKSHFRPFYYCSYNLKTGTPGVIVRMAPNIQKAYEAIEDVMRNSFHVDQNGLGSFCQLGAMTDVCSDTAAGVLEYLLSPQTSINPFFDKDLYDKMADAFGEKPLAKLNGILAFPGKSPNGTSRLFLPDSSLLPLISYAELVHLNLPFGLPNGTIEALIKHSKDPGIIDRGTQFLNLLSQIRNIEPQPTKFLYGAG